MLIDRFHRIHNYLRISITDNCNFRCTYCMPEEYHSFLSSEKLMTASEIETLASVFVQHGVNKIRLTGGEPLIRKDFNDILQRLAQFNVELLITTNGSMIHKYIDSIEKAGITSINVSLDSLEPSSFWEITGRKVFEQIWSNIMLLLKRDFRVKINVVAIKGRVEHELINFVELTKKLPLHIRFIEFMPFTGNRWNKNAVITAQEMLSITHRHFDIIKLKDEPHETAKKYKVIGYEGTFAFITTMSKQFCGECNRLRLTSEGKIKNCLFGKEELDLLSALRKGEDISSLILESVKGKYAVMGGQFEKGYIKADTTQIVNRSMVCIGG